MTASRICAFWRSVGEAGSKVSTHAASSVCRAGHRTRWPIVRITRSAGAESPSDEMLMLGKKFELGKELLHNANGPHR